ncbi:MAG: phosphomannomutase/phosphoglucomutase [Bacilli bacterium]|nr:phosphomannomutase/phosphoglucomutase [Bacilli bacterium]
MNIKKNINKNIFREYDIRGVYGKDIDEDVSYTIGRAYGTYIKKFGQSDCVIGYDNRLSSPSLTESLIEGIISTGIHVVNIGLVTTPMYYYACLKTKTPAGIMVTASHNPKEDNGFKMSFDNRGNAKGKMIEEFREFLELGNFDNGNGIVSFMDITDDYYKLMRNSINLGERNIKVVIDCGNGTTALFAPNIYNMFNLSLMILYGKSDGNFPNHHPDPTVPENMEVLANTVKELKADIGIAFDGDGDRVGIVDEQGNIIPADKYLIIMIRDLVIKNDNKKFLYDVKCSKSLIDEIDKLGATGICSRTGNSYTKARTMEEDCILGGEYSGHIFFRDRWQGFDSGIYAGLRLVEVLSHTNKKLSELLDGINEYYSTPEIKIACSDDKKNIVVNSVLEYAKSKNYNILDIDGVRVNFSDGWALVRASNTGPNLTVRFEGVSLEVRDKYKDEFMEVINKNIN